MRLEMQVVLHQPDQEGGVSGLQDSCEHEKQEG